MRDEKTTPVESIDLSRLTRDILQEHEYEWLLQKDYEIYPAKNHVTEEVLQEWYVHNPEFCTVFRYGSDRAGVNVTIPLSRIGWRGLVNGDLVEAQCRAGYIYNPEKDNEIGLHIYHIRKSMNIRSFYKLALSSLGHMVLGLRAQNPSLRVIGFSGLCVTEMGIGLFFNKLNCRESAFLTEEHIVKKNGHLAIIKAGNYGALEKKLSEGYAYMHRCKMLLAYPNDASIVWSYISP
jgi:hypothetical protein